MYLALVVSVSRLLHNSHGTHRRTSKKHYTLRGTEAEANAREKYLFARGLEATGGIPDYYGSGDAQSQLEFTWSRPDLVANGQEGRPDLGYVGNEIRYRAGSDFSKDMFENYWLGKGVVHLSRSRFNDIVSHAGAAGKPRNVTLSNGQPGVARVHSFYGDSNPYALVLGRATIYYQGGSPVGFQDGYDFNWRWMWGDGSRTVPNELKTRAVSTAGFFYGAEPFNIYYGIRP